MKIIFSFFTLSLVILMTGCETKVKTTEAAKLATVIPESTGFLLSYKFEVEDQVVGQDGCLITFKRFEDKEKIQIEFKYGKEFVFAETKPGTYGLHNFTCGRYNWDLTEDEMAPFQVQQGKISMVAPIRIRISDAKRIATRGLKRKLQYDEMQKIWGLISSESKQALVSGYTLKPINEEMFQQKNSWNTVEVSYDGKIFSKIDAKKFVSFKTCYKGEGMINDLWLGELRMDVDFSNKSEPIIQVEDGKHIFSDHFVDCVKSTLKEPKNLQSKIKRAHIVL